MMPSATLICDENIRMAENTVRLQAWCSAARQVLVGAGRISSGDSDSQLKHIHACVRRTFHGPRAVNLALVNGQTSLMTLPDRVLRQILFLVVLRDRRTLAAACKHLHKRCNALALYRPMIHVRPSDPLLAYKPSISSVEHAITIARQTMPDYLESVTLTWWPELSHELARFLSGNLARVRSLKVYLPFTIFRDPDYATELFAALATPAPVLAHLHLTVETHIFGGTAPTTINAFADPLVARHLSSLRGLYISGMHVVVQSGLVFADVREFCWSHSAPATLTRATLVSLVECFPRMETLRIRSVRLSWAAASLPVRTSLRHVYVDGFDQIDYVDLHGFLEATRIPLLTLTCPKKVNLPESLARASASVSFGFMFYEFTLKPPSRAGRSAAPVVRYLTPMMHLRVERQRLLPSLRHVTCLTLLELFWPQSQTRNSRAPYASGPAISLPALTHLRVSLAPCRSRRALDDEYVSGILLGLDGPLSPLQTPALRNLEVSYYALSGSLCIDPFVETGGFPKRRACFCCRTLGLSLHDLHRFVTACILLPNGRCLEQIRVSGVEVIDTDPFPCIELLEQLAAVVSVSSVPKPNSCDLGADLWESNVMYLR